MKANPTLRRHNSESGFVLLFVFMMAAAAAIGLYLELPKVAFEAQREKEELLVERGLEYRRAIQLYVRKEKKYPQTIENLESTNSRRYLRRRYIDPMTGKDEWRLVHIGPAGEFTDSLVMKPTNPLEQKKEGWSNSFISEAPSMTNTGANGPTGVTVANRLRQSDMQGAPGQSVPGQEPNPGQQPPQDGQQHPNPPSNPGIGYYQQPGTQPQQSGQQGFPQQQQVGYPQQPGQQPVGFPPSPGQQPPVGFNPVGQVVPGVGSSDRFNYRGPGFNPAANSQTGGVVPQQTGFGQQQTGFGQQQTGFGQQQTGFGQQQTGFGQQQTGFGQQQSGFGQQQSGFGQQQSGFGQQQSSFGQQQSGFGQQPGFGQAPPVNRNAIDSIMQSITQPRPGGAPPGVTGGGLSAGNAFGGGIAGVASKFEAEGIKLINERSKYNEWEFLYDYRRDPWGQSGVNLGQGAANPGNTVGQPRSPSSFGNPAGGSGFGGSSSGFGSSGSSFGNSGSSFGNSGSSFGGSSTPTPAPRP